MRWPRTKGARRGVDVGKVHFFLAINLRAMTEPMVAGTIDAGKEMWNPGACARVYGDLLLLRVRGDGLTVAAGWMELGSGEAGGGS